MRHKWTVTMLGLFVAVAGILAMWLIILMGSRMFKDDYRVSAFFNNVAGLGTGVSVRMAGYRIGEVSDIEFLPPHESKKYGREGVWVRVGMDINKEYPIAEDAELQLNPQLVLGEVYLDVTIGSSREQLPMDGSAVIEKVRVGKTTVERAVEDAMEKVDRVEARLTRFLDGMNDLLEFLAREDLRGDVRETIAHLSRITGKGADSMGELEDFVKELRGMVATGEHTFARINDLASTAQEGFAQFSGTAGNIEGKISQAVDIFDTTTRDLSEASEEFTKLLNELRAVAGKKDGSLGMLLNSPEMHDTLVQTMLRLRASAKGLQRAAAQVEVTAATLDRQPSSLLWGRDNEPKAVRAGGQTLGPNDIGID